ERLVERAAARYAEAAERQFDTQVKRAREEAARRLARELDRGVEAYARQAENALAEKLTQAGDAGAKRVERRIAERVSGLERQSDEPAWGIAQRVGEIETDLRRRLESMTTDLESERAVLEARLQELSHRLDEMLAAARR